MASTTSVATSVGSVVSSRSLRAQKRTRRELTADEIRALHKRKMDKISETIKSARLTRSKSKIFLVPEAVICQVFAFLTVKDHCALSLSSEKLSSLSLLPAASPYQVTIPTTRQVCKSKKFLELSGTSSSLFDDSLTDTITMKIIIDRLLRFRPHNLSLRMHPAIQWEKLGAMTQLRELSVQSDTHAPICLYASPSEWEWLSHLTNLTNLTLPDTVRPSISYLPSSLTQVNLLDDERHQEATRDLGDSMIIRSLFTATHLTSLQVVKSVCGVIIDPNQDQEQDQDQDAVPTYQSFQSLSQSFPALRRLEYGLLGGDSVGELKILLPFPQLQDLSVSCNYDQVCDWGILAGIPSLRKLRLIAKKGYHHYNNQILVNIFDSIRQISQLTHLELNFELDNPIFFDKAATAALKHLATQTSELSSIDLKFQPSLPHTPPSVSWVYSKKSLLPNLQTLILGNGFTMTDARFLSVFSSLTTIQLPVTVEQFPQLPNLHTLNLSDNGISGAIQVYKDQLRHVNILSNEQNNNNRETSITLAIMRLCQVEKIETLGLSDLAREMCASLKEFKHFCQQRPRVLIHDYVPE